ncbi:5-formyltetrahydrofolate cyclo-ligase [Tissierella creatinophila]|uniref:5-formyltetrahydrofolate cyclo-ligase n=1 Tax=Tissierella creatinophila DSM 6911 TaxID=1123403 RepID=A0A1U7M6V7_TISCR|nr:5-formyltetrahydrofolate cyclo-ligase [Tissierella creatinophila]OLS03052.1 putative 5-formyltetrahydrofolate cyclo-ligase [Tissierella creatinophila DSM 6911]
MEKKLIREQILKKRKTLSEETREIYSQKITNKLLASSHYMNAKTIMCFISFSDEVDTHDFIKSAIQDGKKIVVPVTFPKTHELKPSRVKDFNELEPGYYNILTPKKEFERFIDPKDIDLVITPGVAFRKDGYRVGYGGGYYDRFLSKIPNTITIAICFSIQLVDELPTDSFDIPVDYIYTEKNIVTCK